MSQQEQQTPVEATMSRSRIVALPIPMQGHISPMLQLCYQLAASGIDITFVNLEQNHKKLVGSSSPVSKVFSSGTITFVAVSVPQEFHGGVNSSINAALVAIDAFAEPLEALLPTLERVSFLLTDGYMGWSQVIADKFNIPRVALWTSNVGYNLVNYHLPMLIAKGYASRRKENSSSADFDDDHRVTCIPGVDPMHPRDLPSIIQYESEKDPGFASRINKLQALKRAEWVLINSVEELEMKGVEAMRNELGTTNYITVGPLLQQMPQNRISLWKEDAACMDWLDKQKPGSVLYISFGSLATLSSSKLHNIAKALDDLQQPFLWTMRSDLCISSDTDRESLESFVDRSRESGLGIVVEWSPQLEVLKHPATGGHLTHCGWNSVMESMLAGAPMLGWPCVAEQTMNCKRIVDWGIGLRFTKNLNEEIVSDAEISRVMKQLFAGEEGVFIRGNIKRFSELMRKALEPGGSSQLNLNKFIQAISG